MVGMKIISSKYTQRAQIFHKNYNSHLLHTLSKILSKLILIKKFLSILARVYGAIPIWCYIVRANKFNIGKVGQFENENDKFL